MNAREPSTKVEPTPGEAPLPSETTCSTLFVYGTLRPASGHAMARYLAGKSCVVGPARFPGRLYDLGRYPGLREPADEQEWVHGDVVRLREPDETLAVLDRYEGCEPDGASLPLFERCLVQARLATGEDVSCWAYFYRGQVTEGQRIASGDYYRRGTLDEVG
jgi:gamma-glutamylcyclotransferase (GGCT)/AIG2-like uncharacterized protein YtfP